MACLKPSLGHSMEEENGHSQPIKDLTCFVSLFQEVQNLLSALSTSRLGTCKKNWDMM